jgi:hypothetical protein
MSSMESELEKIAKDAGADLVGFTDRARLADAPPSGDLTYVLPSAQSAIGLAVSLDQEAAERYIAKEDMWAFNDSRLLHPTARVENWVNPTLESIIAEMTPAAATDLD